MANVTTLTDSNGVTKDICDQYARDSISQGGANETAATAISDLNDLTKGVAYVNSSTANRPIASQSGAICVAFKAGSNLYNQLLFDSSGNVYTRRHESSGWKSWYSISTSVVS